MMLGVVIAFILLKYAKTDLAGLGEVVSPRSNRSVVVTLSVPAFLKTIWPTRNQVAKREITTRVLPGPLEVIPKGHLIENIMSEERYTGKVKYFNLQKHYGFITDDRDGTDYFFPYTSLPYPDDLPDVGDRAYFQLARRGVRYRAINLIWIRK